MADTLYTSDGKMHILLGSTTLVSLIQKYMGDDAAQMVETLEQEKEALEKELESLWKAINGDT